MRSGTARVDVARTDEVLARLPEPYSAWLSESEQARLPTLKVEARRKHYLAGHWLARELLARAFGGTAHDWPLAECRGLPPQVLRGDGDLRVSISHSGDWIAAAAADAPIGIDIEQRPRILDPSIEPLLLNADEAPGSLSQEEMLRRWVGKEAWIKMLAESALPDRLKQLQLRRSATTEADVVIHQDADCCFGVALLPTVARHWPRGGEPGMSAAYRVIVAA